MTTNVQTNITISGTYPNFTYSFDGDDINASTGKIDLSSVTDSVNLKFKIKTNGFSFANYANGNAPLEIDGTPANDLSGQFSGYSKTDSKNLKIEDANSDGVNHEYSLHLTDGTHIWTLDPKLQNRDAA